MQSLVLKLQTKYILHPYFVVILFMLTEQKLNFIITTDNLLCSLIVMLIFVGTTSLFLYVFPHKYKHSAGLWLSFLLGFIFFGDNLQEVVVFTIPSLQAHARIVYFVVIFIVLLFILVLKTYKKQLFSLNLYLNCLLFGFCMVELVGIMQHNYHTKQFTKIDEKMLSDNSRLISLDSLPNIYFILIDGYTNAKSLKKVWNYDNQPFLDSMKNHAYHNIKNAKSNYYFTKRSLAGILNGQYLSEYFKEKHLEFCSQAINNSSLGQFLEQNGYQTTTISPFMFNRKVDNLYSNHWTLEISIDFKHLYLYYIDKTVFKSILKLLLNDRNHIVAIERHKNMSLRALKEFKAAIKMSAKKPKLVYLHLFITHNPFIFTEKGELRTDFSTENSIEKYKKLYLDQIKYLNIVLLDLVKTIKKDSNRPAIVLLTGDHGARFWTGKEGLEESYSTTTLFSFPNKKYETLYDSMSSVNLFRAVINNALNKKLIYLPDTVVVLPDDVPEIE
jgi:hypothetical protein